MRSELLASSGLHVILEAAHEPRQHELQVPTDLTRMPALDCVTTLFFCCYVQRSREVLVDSQVGLVALEELALDQRLDPLLNHARVGQEARFELLRHLRVRKAQSRRRADTSVRVRGRCRRFERAHA